MSFRSFAKWVLLCTIACVLCPMALVHAQEQEDTEKSEKEEAKTYPDTLVVAMKVVSASKKEEKLLEAPSTIEVVDDEAILYSPSTTFSGALAQVKGVDFANGGINLQKISTRGFSSSFNSRMLGLIDGRLASLPGAGLPQGGLSSLNSLDIKSIELILGPAGALYGSNTTAGVMNVITKDAWDETGFAGSLRGGDQSLIDFKFRYAGNTGDEGFGWKITGEYLDADEFTSDNVFNIAGANQTSYASDADVQAALDAGLAYRETALVADDNVTSMKYDFTGYYKTRGVTLQANYGYSENDSFGVTNVGRNRILDWGIDTYQFRASAKHWFFNATYTDETAGHTYSIQSVPGYLAAGMTFEEAAYAARFENESSLIDYELQGNAQFGNLELIVGGQYREYDPSSNGTYLDDFGDNDISRDETGLYLQADYRAMDGKLRFVAAGRYDDFSAFDSEFSPKFGVTYQHNTHFWRANYITSYRAPEIIENHLYFLGGVARGNLDGYDVYMVNPAGNDMLLTSYPGLTPEEVDTIELGYRGLFGSHVAMEAVVYDSDYTDFISPLQWIANYALGTYAVSSSGEVIPFLLTYLNYGAADIRGADLGLDIFFTDDAVLHTSIGYSSLKTFDNDTTIPDIPFNTPEWKVKADLTLKNFAVENNFVTIGGRFVDEYDYLSGNWNGTIQANTVFDMAVGYIVPDKDLIFKFSWSNMTDSDKTELLGTPAIPTFVSFEIYKKF